MLQKLIYMESLCYNPEDPNQTEKTLMSPLQDPVTAPATKEEPNLALLPNNSESEKKV